MRNLIGRTLGHYRIVEKIGEGGMGEVYRAHDERLDREVAVKVLPEAVAANSERLARFEREARAVARISHPNILAVHELGSHEGVPFIVTELLEGESLREVIGDRRLTPQRAIEYSKQVARGLAAAHEKEIVHRDLKPGNVFITSDGVVKVLDFGLAKLKQPDMEGEPGTEARTLTKETDPGKVMGTVGYMSPEQVRAETADHRSDIFSLGVVMYEMFSGQRPFRAASSAEIMTAIMQENPPHLSQLEPEVQPSLERVVSRCLEKRPADRFQSARDLAFDLQGILSDSDQRPAPAEASAALRPQRIALWAATAAVVIAIGLWAILGDKPTPALVQSSDFVPNRVVVAEFENRIGDPSFDDFGTHVADSVTNLLRQVDRLTVATNPHRSGGQASTSSGEISGGNQVRRLAEATQSGLVITGACYARGDQVEIRARVVDPWRDEVKQSFDAVRAPASDPSLAVEGLSQMVAGTLALHYANVIPLGLSRPVPLAAVKEFAGATEDSRPGFEAMISRLQRALEIDPEFHLARWVLLRWYAGFGRHRDAEAELEVLERYLPDMTQYDRTIVRAARAELEGRPLVVLSALREAVDLAQNTHWIRNEVGKWAIRTNHPREAVEVLSGIPFDWTSGVAGFVQRPFVNLCLAHHMLGNDEAVLRLAAESLEHLPDAMIFYGLQANVLGVMGRFEEMDRIIEESLAVRHHSRTSAGVSLTFTARELRAHGHHERSLDVAERAVEWFRERPDEMQREPWFYAAGLNAAERWHEARDFAGRMVREEPGAVQYLGLLGVLEARVGRIDEARRIAEELHASQDQRSRAERTYWRACITAQLGQIEEAVSLLQRAFSEGLRFSDEFHRDINLEPLWDSPPFQELIEPKG